MLKSSQKGQILLTVILVLIIASTIGLSVASRSIISLKTSTEEAESQKALFAAEAGIERAIQSNVIATGEDIIQGNNTSNNSKYTTTVAKVQGSSFLLNGGSTIAAPTPPAGGPTPTPKIIPNVVPKDEGADIWFVGHDANGNPDYNAKISGLSSLNLNLYWKSPPGSPSEDCSTSAAPPAIELIAVTRNSATDIKTYRYTYDSCPGRGNNFTPAVHQVDENGAGNIPVPELSGVTFSNKMQDPINLSSPSLQNIVLMRVIPIYRDAVIAVSACNNGGQCNISLSPQGYIISSTGTSGEASRTLTNFKGYLQTYLPYVSYGLFVAN
ncbi:MAG: pilus assembly PilX N-terminal domain-containing protein [bacterium]|nr:pilus assembly PilX N-terminal domain-containing protein [bacterium]